MTPLCTPFSFPGGLRSGSVGFLQCFRDLGSGQPKINSEKHFPPGREHNKSKVEAVTLTVRWKLSQAEVREKKKEQKGITCVCVLAEWQNTQFSFITFQLAR